MRKIPLGLHRRSISKAIATKVWRTRKRGRNVPFLQEPMPMTVYAVAQITITDRAAYNRYQAHFMEVFSRFQGTLLAADEAPQVLEGVWQHQKIIMMSFPDEAAFHAWMRTPAYQEISKDRLAGSHGVVLLVAGLPARN
jgi:uncharacterized protein (DUF1330 family)